MKTVSIVLSILLLFLVIGCQGQTDEDIVFTPREYMEGGSIIFETPDESLYTHTSEEILEYMLSQYDFGEEAKGLVYRVYRKNYSTKELEPVWLVLFIEANVSARGYIYQHIYFYVTAAGRVFGLGPIPQESMELVNPDDPFELGTFDKSN